MFSWFKRKKKDKFQLKISIEKTRSSGLLRFMSSVNQGEQLIEYVWIDRFNSKENVDRDVFTVNFKTNEDMCAYIMMHSTQIEEVGKFIN